MTIMIVSFLLVLIFLFIVIESVRRGILGTKYSMLWIVTCVILGVLSMNETLLTSIANILDVFYPPSVLFLFGLLFSLIMIFDLTRRVSQLNSKLVILTQEFTLLKDRYKKEVNDKKGTDN